MVIERHTLSGLDMRLAACARMEETEVRHSPVRAITFCSWPAMDAA
jgi:hypothetical protein